MFTFDYVTTSDLDGEAILSHLKIQSESYDNVSLTAASFMTAIAEQSKSDSVELTAFAAVSLDGAVAVDVSADVQDELKSVDAAVKAIDKGGVIVAVPIDTVPIDDVPVTVEEP